MDHEIHLFILWDKSSPKWDDIVADLDNKFTILQVWKVQWTRRKFSQNLTRFYGTTLPSANQKEKHCGNGSFLAIVVKDTFPVYEERKTSRGNAVVNVNIFDAKQSYREWTGGGHKVHATNNIKETEHDLALLVNHSYEEFITADAWSGEVMEYNQDLVGHDGWWSLEQFFQVLNRTINYVVLRNYEKLPEEWTINNHRDIDLLTDDYQKLVLIANGRKVFNKSFRVHYKVKIAGEDVFFDFRFVGDNYYDQNWQERMLYHSIFYEKGFYVLEENDYFYSLLYHALVHKRKLAPDYQEKLLRLGKELNIYITEENCNDPECLKILLDSFMEKNNYCYTKPKDRTVYFNRKLVGNGKR